MTLKHVERERNYCSVAHELKVPFIAVDANCSKCSRARESRLVRLSKECKHEQHGRRVDAISADELLHWQASEFFSSCSFVSGKLELENKICDTINSTIIIRVIIMCE